METRRETIHEAAVRIRRSIAGDLQAAERYRELGRPEDVAASLESAAHWEEQLRRRLRGQRMAHEGRVHG